MPKVIPSKLPASETNKMLNLLYIKIAALKTKAEVANFLSDLLTESEKIMILRRLQIAKLLLEDCTYQEVRNKLGVGIDTIKNIRHKLEKGQGGYINFIKKIVKR